MRRLVSTAIDLRPLAGHLRLEPYSERVLPGSFLPQLSYL